MLTLSASKNNNQRQDAGSVYSEFQYAVYPTSVRTSTAITQMIGNIVSFRVTYSNRASASRKITAWVAPNSVLSKALDSPKVHLLRLQFGPESSLN